MTDIVLIADAEIGAAADRLTRGFHADVEAMLRRRAAAGSVRSGAMLIETRTLGEAALAALRDEAEAVIAATWGRGLWISEQEEAALLQSAGVHLGELHSVVLKRVRDGVQRIAARSVVLDELEPPLQQCLNDCKQRLVLIMQQQRQGTKTSLAKRTFGLIPGLLRSAVKAVFGAAGR